MAGFYGRNVPRDNTSDIPVLTDIIYYKIGEDEYSANKEDKKGESLDALAAKDSVYINRYILVEENGSKSLYQKRYENGPHYVFISAFTANEEIKNILEKLNFDSWNDKDILYLKNDGGVMKLAGGTLKVQSPENENYGSFTLDEKNKEIILKLNNINGFKTSISPVQIDDNKDIEDIIKELKNNLTLENYLGLLYSLLRKKKDELKWTSGTNVIYGGNALDLKYPDNLVENADPEDTEEDELIDDIPEDIGPGVENPNAEDNNP